MRWRFLPVILFACQDDTRNLEPQNLPEPTCPALFALPAPRCLAPWSETFGEAPQTALLDSRAEKLLYPRPGGVVTVNLLDQNSTSEPIEHPAVELATTPDFSAFATILAQGEIHDIYWWGNNSGYLHTLAEPWRADGHRVPLDNLRLSGNGKYLFFSTSADSFLIPDTNLLHDVYRLTLATSKLERISLGAAETDGPAYGARTHWNGDKVWFISTAISLGARFIGEGDVFFWENGEVKPAGFEERNVTGLEVSANGCVVITETANGLVIRDADQQSEIIGQRPVLAPSGRYLTYLNAQRRPVVREISTGAEAPLDVDGVTGATQALSFSADDGYLTAVGYGPTCPRPVYDELGQCQNCNCRLQGLYVMRNPLLPNPCNSP